MANLVFYVSRRNEEKIECTAIIPNKADFGKFKGGEILVKTPKGDRKVSVSGFEELFLGQIAIELQNGVRDFLLPKADSPKSGNGKRTKYTD